MKVSFKGTYAISGNSILYDSAVKVSNFLKETKGCRKDTGKTALNCDTFDYYLGVKDDKEADFEEIAQKYNIKTRKDSKSGNLIEIVGNCSSPECEFDSILEAVVKYFNRRN